MILATTLIWIRLWKTPVLVKKLIVLFFSVFTGFASDVENFRGVATSSKGATNNKGDAKNTKNVLAIWDVKNVKVQQTINTSAAAGKQVYRSVLFLVF